MEEEWELAADIADNIYNYLSSYIEDDMILIFDNSDVLEAFIVDGPNGYLARLDSDDMLNDMLNNPRHSIEKLRKFQNLHVLRSDRTMRYILKVIEEYYADSELFSLDEWSDTPLLRRLNNGNPYYHVKKKGKTEKINKAREQIKKQGEKVVERVKKQIAKQNKRSKNLFCVNDKDYITLEEMEDIPTKDLIKLHLNKKVHCFDKDSLSQILTQLKRGYKDDKSYPYYRIDLSFPIFIGKSTGDTLSKNLKTHSSFSITKINKTFNIGMRETEIYTIRKLKEKIKREDLLIKHYGGKKKRKKPIKGGGKKKRKKIVKKRKKPMKGGGKKKQTNGGLLSDILSFFS